MFEVFDDALKLSFRISPSAVISVGGLSHVLIRKCRYHRRHVTNALFLRRCVRL